MDILQDFNDLRIHADLSFAILLQTNILVEYNSEGKPWEEKMKETSVNRKISFNEFNQLQYRIHDFVQNNVTMTEKIHAVL